MDRMQVAAGTSGAKIHAGHVSTLAGDGAGKIDTGGPEEGACRHDSKIAGRMLSRRDLLKVGAMGLIVPRLIKPRPKVFDMGRCAPSITCNPLFSMTGEKVLTLTAGFWEASWRVSWQFGSNVFIVKDGLNDRKLLSECKYPIGLHR